jgi:glycosyltransferase involved in cell wall biosynthesis
VVTDIPAFRTFARPSDFAEFVPVADPAALAAAVDRLLDHPGARRRLSARGQEVAAGYRLERSRHAMEEALNDILGGRPPHAA